MAEGSYQVIFSGRIIDGAELDMVKHNVARVFNLDAERVEKLFCGRRLILKKQIDQATAEKYQTTMQRAGALCEVENTAQARPAAPSASAAQPEATPPQSETTSEVDAGVSLAEPGVELIEHVEVPEADIDISGMDMAEVGIQLAEHEVVPEVEFDTSDMSLDVAGVQLVEAKEVPAANIDTSHLSAE